tara:strand:+ start:1394 stop:1852 length:459 start_codon:yes stop_codon:yes gene_type:complete
VIPFPSTLYLYINGDIMPSVYSEKICPACEEEYRGRGKHCSQKCSNDSKRHEKIKLWLEGKHNGLRGKTATAAWIKRWLRETKDNSCVKCGWDEIHPITNNVPVELNHIDGNYLNNRPENLELLCPNCHSLTDSYRSLNIGNGRPYDRSNKK